jgi:hypothetical protein
VAIKGGLDECGGCEFFDWFVTKVRRDGFPQTSGAALHEGEEEL